MMRAAQERRIHPRVNQELPFKVNANGYGFSTNTQNISCVGAYCRIKKYMPPFTKVMVRLTLPIKSGEGDKNYTIDCAGVIVRTEDESKGGFNIAIFFNAIKDEQRKKISKYINQFIPRRSPALNPIS
ncbi:MAG: hypothetical protein COT38_03240 [Candidatus Omnitrophica bacterium CG08_land_8_20_14_0_20_41_16]|nr:MAG: hypothetical protein COT38_03240 [Candidatus Omnitrophica bacterium CG08_land_8_20_14_0_20_41_16]